MSLGTIKMLGPEPGVVIGPGAQGVPSAPPPGFRPLIHAPAGLETLAKGLLKEEYGVRAQFRADGRNYMARIEPHPPAPERGLKDWHKGVTVYEVLEGTRTWEIGHVGLLLLAFGVGGWMLGAVLK